VLSAGIPTSHHTLKASTRAPVADFVPGYEASARSGIGAPKNKPTEIIDKLNKEIIAALTDSAMQTRLADLGLEPMPMTPSDLRATSRHGDNAFYK
jgi:hypothetical protein